MTQLFRVVARVVAVSLLVVWVVSPTTAVAQSTCPSGYYNPGCKYTADSLVEVVAKYANTTAKPYESSYRLKLSYYDTYGLTDSSSGVKAVSVLRRLVNKEPADRSFVLIVFLMRGDIVDPIVSTFSPTSTFSTSNALLSLQYYTKAPAAAGSMTGSGLIFEVTISGHAVPFEFETIAWVVGALITLILVPTIEGIMGCCCRNMCSRGRGHTDDDAMVATYREKMRQRKAAEQQQQQQQDNSGYSNSGYPQKSLDDGPTPEAMAMTVSASQQEDAVSARGSANEYQDSSANPLVAP